MKRRILFIDNNMETRQRWERLLQDANFDVCLAGDPESARQLIAEGGIDLIVIDLRLQNDDLVTDKSGLELACDPKLKHYPKIIFTAYQLSEDDRRKVWQPFGEEPPAVVAFVSKSEKPGTLLNAIDQAFIEWPRLRRMVNEVSDRISSDHATVRQQARLYYLFSVLMSVFGFSVIITGIVLASLQAVVNIGYIAAISGLILNAIGVLFFVRQDRANQRMDQYHQELLQTYGVEFILSVIEELPARRGEENIEITVRALIESWYPKAQGLP